MADYKDISLIIPTLNAGPFIPDLVRSLDLLAFPPSRVTIIDSSSSDDTRRIFSEWGATVLSISRNDFDHGGTRRLASARCSDAEIQIFLTQDALPLPGSLSAIIRAFDDPLVGMAYGRQLPRPTAAAIERFARIHNYPEKSVVKSYADRKALGIRTIFASNSFAAYRKKVLDEVGGIPSNSYFGEDQVVAAEMLLLGYRLAYCADARVVHSHQYTVMDDFRRYFDVGVFHSHNPRLLSEFGTVDRAGWRYLATELSYLRRHAVWLVPEALLRSAAKLFAYRLGRSEARISWRLKMMFSLQKFYWLRSRRGPNHSEQARP